MSSAARAQEAMLPSSMSLVECLRERIRLLAPKDGEDPDELQWKADHALYRCKSEWRGSFAFYGLGEGPK